MKNSHPFHCALITGATGGLGKALAEFLAKKDIELMLTSRSSPDLPVDLSDPQSRNELLKAISDKCPDLIINSAGFGLYGKTLSHSIEEHRKMIRVNVNALVEISIHAAKELIRAGKKGTILNISSAASFFAFPSFNTYAASKAFVNHFSLGLDAELRGQGIRVLCACPGQIATHFRASAAKGHPQQPDRRTMSVEDAVNHLWKQIEKEKRLYIFDWRTQMMVWGSKLVPSRILERILESYIQDRIPRE